MARAGTRPAGGHIFMKRVLVLALILGAVSAAVLTAQTKPAAGDDAVMQADHALVNALENGVRPDFDVPCLNPCKEVPYKPISASEKAALENWQDQESGNGHHDMHMGDQEVTIGSNTMNPRKSATAPGPTPVNRQPGRPV